MTNEEILKSDDIKLVKRHFKRLSDNCALAYETENRHLNQIIELLNENKKLTDLFTEISKDAISPKKWKSRANYYLIRANLILEIKALTSKP